MKPYKLGILGGMGSFATATFFQRIVENTKAKNDQEHIDMIILNHASLPDRTETIINNKNQDFLQAIKGDLKLLENKVNHIAIPCNTSHYYMEDMQKMVTIPIINMVQSTVKKIRSDFGENSRVAVLATDGTIQTKVYERELTKHGLVYHPLNETLQSQVMDIIYQFKADSQYTTPVLTNIIRHLITDDQCDCVIVACTELSCIAIDPDLKLYYVDALDVLVEQSIKSAKA